MTMTTELLKQAKELLLAVTDLASLLDQPLDQNRHITIDYIWASQIINSALINAREMVCEIECTLGNE